MKALLIGTVVLTLLVASLPVILDLLEKTLTTLQRTCIACTIGVLAGLLFLIPCLMFFLELATGTHAFAISAVGAMAFAVLISYVIKSQLSL